MGCLQISVDTPKIDSTPVCRGTFPPLAFANVLKFFFSPSVHLRSMCSGCPYEVTLLIWLGKKAILQPPRTKAGEHRCNHVGQPLAKPAAGCVFSPGGNERSSKRSERDSHDGPGCATSKGFVVIARSAGRRCERNFEHTPGPRGKRCDQSPSRAAYVLAPEELVTRQPQHLSEFMRT